MGIQFKGGTLSVRRFHWHKQLEEAKYYMGLASGRRGPAVDPSLVTAPDWAEVCHQGMREDLRHVLSA